MDSGKVIDALTNGVGEKPYCRRVDGFMTVFVADDQELCTIAQFDNDEEAAEAICEAGLLLSKLQKQSNLLTLGLLQEKRA